MTVPEIQDLDKLSHEQILNKLPQKVDEILDLDCNRDTKLMNVCVLLEKSVENYDWVGFYFADPKADRELVLGPYVGEATDHTRIPYGVGICGQVAESKETFVVDDVNEESNYLSCSPSVRSEIVVPILKDGKFVAQLDIDSHVPSAISPSDKETLEQICEKLVYLF